MLDFCTSIHVFFYGQQFTLQFGQAALMFFLHNLQDVGGILPALARLSYAGKHMEDAQRTLEHYGVAFWHARFPHWPIKIRRF
jgi:hypothetical protein